MSAVVSSALGRLIPGTSRERVSNDTHDVGRRERKGAGYDREFEPIKLMEPIQAAFLGSDWDDAPDPGNVWRPVDIGQGTESARLVTDEETGLADLIAEERGRPQ